MDKSEGTGATLDPWDLIDPFDDDYAKGGGDRGQIDNCKRLRIQGITKACGLWAVR